MIPAGSSLEAMADGSVIGYMGQEGEQDYYVLFRSTGRKVEDPELLEAIRLTIINNMIQYHPVPFVKDFSFCALLDR